MYPSATNEISLIAKKGSKINILFTQVIRKKGHYFPLTVVDSREVALKNTFQLDTPLLKRI